MAACSVVDIPDPSQLSDSQLLRHIFASVSRMEETLTAQQTKITTLEGEVSTLNKKVYQLENMLNLREQERRGLTIRVSGLPFMEEEKAATDSKFLSKKVYERILQPLLVQAKASNFIDKIPLDSTAPSPTVIVFAPTLPSLPPPSLRLSLLRSPQR